MYVLSTNNYLQRTYLFLRDLETQGVAGGGGGGWELTLSFTLKDTVEEHDR